MIRVLLVDDSPTTLTVLSRMLAQSGEVVVAGTARDGEEALRLVPELRPDVICTDLEMPGMDGYALIDTVMRTMPCPILVVSSYVQQDQTDNIFRALELGAIDVFPKPRGGITEAELTGGPELARKIRVLSGVVPLTRRTLADPLAATTDTDAGRTPPRIVGIGASVGGPQALRTILSGLPGPLTTPVLCVQHISGDFYRSLIDWLQPVCPMPIRIATDGETPMPGVVYLPRSDRHLLVDDGGRLASSLDPPVDGHRPSVSATFASAAQYYGAATLGVLLTGMGRDGADGLLAIARAGGTTVAQDEQTSVVFGMAREATRLGAAQHLLPVERIADLLARRAIVRRGR
jgi:two-component system chemotaxis response regulator CheB